MSGPICAPLPCAAVTTQPAPPPAHTGPPDVGPWALGGLFVAVFLIAVGIAGMLFPKRRPRRWGP